MNPAGSNIVSVLWYPEQPCLGSIPAPMSHAELQVDDKIYRLGAKTKIKDFFRAADKAVGNGYPFIRFKIQVNDKELNNLRNYVNRGYN